MFTPRSLCSVCVVGSASQTRAESAPAMATATEASSPVSPAYDSYWALASAYLPCAFSTSA
ncbi:hypothetical protein [Parapedobacter soli]|uniref:hypothetical protein n=1 Tax=Parapedobacter soli TaxID=416955 RepID=UPI0021CA9CB3|nr:hypothetical protein [Parapedobacter soli]